MVLKSSELKFVPPSPLSAEKLQLREREKLLTVLKYLANLLQFLGVLPVLSNSKILLKIQRVWCCLLLLIIWTMGIRRALVMQGSWTAIENGLDIGELIFLSILPLNIFIISSTHKEKFLLICESFKRLKEQLKLCRGSSYRPYKPFYRRLRQELLLLTVGVVLFYIYFIILNFVNRHGNCVQVLEIFLTYHLPNIIISASLCLYWLALRLIALAICYTNDILKSFQKNTQSIQFTRRSQVVSFNETLWFQREFGSFNFKNSLKFYDIFVILTEISSTLDQLQREVVEIYRNVLIMSFINSFLILVLQFFEVYKFFDSPDVRTLLAFLLKCARLFLYVFNIIFVLLSNSVIIKQKCQTIYILNSLTADTINMEKYISYFLLQLMVRKHTIYVGDIFELDLSFLLAITSSLAIYVIFLIQIDLGVVSIEEAIAANAK